MADVAANSGTRLSPPKSRSIEGRRHPHQRPCSRGGPVNLSKKTTKFVYGFEAAVHTAAPGGAQPLPAGIG
eukprot:3047440-Amphidinium_carterae.1